MRMGTAVDMRVCGQGCPGCERCAGVKARVSAVGRAWVCGEIDRWVWECENVRAPEGHVTVLV